MEQWNPFAPGVGTPPPELAGPDALLARARIAVARAAEGRPSRGCLLLGLRGVGKTVLLDRICHDATAKEHVTVRLEAPENRSLPALLAHDLRVVLLKLNRFERAKDLAQRGLRALAGFTKSLKFKYADIEVGLDLDPESGLADNGELDHDLTALLETVGQAARAVQKVVLMAVDEMQYVEEDQLAALIVAFHCMAQLGLLEIPITRAGASIDAKALQRIFQETQGHAYFVQEWGKQAWDVAAGPTISEKDVDAASDVAVASLDESFFLVRFDRCTPTEKDYLRAMAELGAGPQRSGQVADLLGKKVSSLGPVRESLITKGMIWSPAHGHTAFTVPLFDRFLLRITPA